MNDAEILAELRGIRTEIADERNTRQAELSLIHEGIGTIHKRITDMDHAWNNVVKEQCESCKQQLDERLARHDVILREEMKTQANIAVMNAATRTLMPFTVAHSSPESPPWARNGDAARNRAWWITPLLVVASIGGVGGVLWLLKAVVKLLDVPQ